MTSGKVNFVHLHVHTAYSLLDSTLRLSDLFKKAKEYQMPAIAMTDHGNLFGAIEFYKQANEAGIKPIIGCELYIAPRSRFEKTVSNTGDASRHLVVLVKNIQGYKNLLRMVTASNLEGFYHHPRVDKEILQQCHEGLIATSSCLHGEVASYILKGDREAAIKAACEYQDIFGEGNFYLEIMENELPEQKIVNEGILEISHLLSIPVVATNDCHYLRADDAEAHEVLQCIKMCKTLDDKVRIHCKTNQFLRSPSEMKHLFSYCPEAISNTVVIADKCNLFLELDSARSVKFHLEKESALNEYLSTISDKGRDYIFRYVMEQCGIDHVAKIIAFRRMRAKSAIHKIGRALHISSADVDAIANMIHDVRNFSLEDALTMDVRLQEEAIKSEKIQKLLSILKTLNGLIINLSTYASGMVISDKPIVDMVPLCLDSKDNLVSQYSINDLQSMGLSIFKFSIVQCK